MLGVYTFLLLLVSTITHAQTEQFNYLNAGDKAPTFTTLNQKREAIDLAELTKKGKVVLLFYRGAWCPHCNRHMSNLQDSLSLIHKNGATIIAVTPEIGVSIDKSIKKTQATYNIVHDSAYAIMNLYGVTFKVNKKTLVKYKLVGINVEEANGNEDSILPVPATFIINKNGIIDFIHFDENYKKRLSVNDILKHL